MNQTLAQAHTSQVKSVLRDLLAMLMGVILYSVGWTGFILSQGVTTGGLAGITSIIQFATNIPVYIPYNIINVGLVIVSIIFLGWKFSLKTFIGVSMLFVFIPVGQALFGDPASAVYQNLASWLTSLIPNVGPLFTTDQSLLAVAFGGIFCGGGLFMVFNVNGSTGGTDVIVALFNKYKNISLGRALIMTDAVIIGASFLVNIYFRDMAVQPAVESLALSAVEIIFCSVTLDFLTNSNKQSVQLFIFSKEYKKISDAIIVRLNKGTTLIHAEGGYSGNSSKILMLVVRKNMLQNVNRIVREIDPDAFVSQGTVHGVYGQGFDTLK